MADTESILQLGIEAARAGDKAEARELFRLVTREDPNNPQGWLWLAGVAEDREEKRAALEHVVEIEPTNDLARKGLAALAAAPAGIAATTEGGAATAAPVAGGDATNVDATNVDAAPSRVGNARQYDSSPEVAVPLPATDAAGTSATPPDDADEYDLQDYEQSPRVSALDPDDRRTSVVVEDEEPASRGGLGWLPALAGAAIILLGGFFLFQSCRNPDNVAQTGGPDAGVTTGPGGVVDPGALTAGPEGTGAVAGLGEPGDLGTGATAGTTVAPATDGATADSPVDQTAPPPADNPPPTGAEQTTIVVVSPDATVVPPAPETPAPAAPPAEAPPAPTTAPAPPPASGDVASANPAIVPVDTVIEAGSWSFTYGGLNNIATGSYGGTTATRGQYQIVLIAAANNSDQPATIPDGYFVLRDAQGRVYDFNRAASVDYLNRFGGAGTAADVGADATFPANSVLTSVPLLFDVPTDATNLVLLSRDNINQGFLVR